MLGLGKRKKTEINWQWDVAGKHPAARDFFALGPKSLMVEAFTEWIRRGAEGLVAVSKELLVRSCSWRFWAKTPQAGVLTCGVIRNSCDSVGRPFPLLVMGTGKLENWEENWELLPFACERVWGQMEQLASKNYGSFELLQEDVHMLRPPRRQWDEMNVEKIALTEKPESRLDVDLPFGQFEQDKALFVPFQDFGQKDFFAMIDNVHSQLKLKVKVVPNSFFMGGLTEQPGLVLLKRPLSRDDFERMWRPETE
jgi:type VI secretion system protein VasJ